MKKLKLNLSANLLSKDQMKSVKGGSGQILICVRSGYENEYCSFDGDLNIDCRNDIEIGNYCYRACGYGFIPLVCGNQ